MKRILMLLAGAAAAAGVWYALSHSARSSKGAVPALLPAGTLAFAHLPDLKKARQQWHHSDIYKLWTEPAVQDFLRKPLTNAPSTGSVRGKMDELEQLGVKDGFLAITAWENDQPKLAGGFRFKGSADDAEKIVGRWRARAEENVPAAQREAINHREHPIQLVRHDAITLASAYYGDRFFAANDVEVVKALLDRADGTSPDTNQTLATDENFSAALKHMPAKYAAMGYARFDKYFQQLKARVPTGAASNDQLAMLQRIRTAAAATTFENGKIRDVLFVGMPKVAPSGELTRASLSLATQQSFLYLATLLDLSERLAPPDRARSSGMPALLQRLVAAFAASGITAEQWNSAFGAEIGIVGDWAENSRMPALFATLPVKDATGANNIVTATITAAGERSGWTVSNRDGVQYYALPPSNPMIPVTPTIAVTDKFAIAGVDPNSVEAATKRASAGNSELAAAARFKAAEVLVPQPSHAFTYVDTALLYERLDAALRPMLVMGAAFVPAIAQAVDLSKLPAPDVVTKHLSPIVLSQRYQHDGYVTESVGPVSIFQAVLGIAGATGVGAAWYQRDAERGMMGIGVAPSASPMPPLPSPPLPSPTASDPP